MIILALDTSGTGCSVAVTDGDALVSEVNLLKNQTHSKHVMVMIDDILRLSGMILADVDAFAVCRGPGSFTGLRIGISTIQGLVTATGKRAVSVSSLDALAYGAGALPGSYLCPMIDARKDEIFSAQYTRKCGTVIRTSGERLVGRGDLCMNLEDGSLLIGSGAFRYRDEILNRMGDKVTFAPESFHHVSAATVAQLARDAFSENQHEIFTDIFPSYIRKSDAEINQAKHGRQTPMV